MSDDIFKPFYAESVEKFRKSIDSGEFINNPFAGKNPRTTSKKILEQAVENYKKDKLDVDDPDQAKAILARLERAVIAQNLKERVMWDIKKEIRDEAVSRYEKLISGSPDENTFNQESKKIASFLKSQLKLASDITNDPDNFMAEIEKRYGKQERADSLAYYLVA
jgi:hypothetical protein